MGNPQKAKGDQFERDVRKLVTSAGVHIIRQHDGGTLDAGDFIVGPFVAQAKAYNDLLRGIREGIDQASSAVERNQLAGMVPLAICKRMSRPIGGAYCVFNLTHLPKLIDSMGRF